MHDIQEETRTYNVNIMKMGGGSPYVYNTTDYFSSKKLSKGDLITIKGTPYVIDAVYADGTIEVFER